MAWKDYFIYSFNFLPLAAGVGDALAAVSVFTDNLLRIHPQSDFQGLKSAYVSTDPRVYIQFFDQSTGRYFTQVPGVDARAFLGTLLAIGPGANALQFRNFGQPVKLSGGAPFNCRASDFSGAPNTVRISIHGVKLRPGNPPWTDLKRNYYKDEYFVYPVQIALLANQTSQNAIAADLDADWFITRILCQRTDAALIKFTTGTSEYEWQDKPVHLDNFSGNIAGYNILPEPKMIQAGTVLSIELSDISGNPNVITLSIEGIKRYF